MNFKVFFVIKVKKTSSACKKKWTEWLLWKEDYVKTLEYGYLRIKVWVLFFLELFASHSICSTVAWGTTRWQKKLVDEVGTTVFYKNLYRIFATFFTITKADILFNFTILYCRMSTIQPAWVFCLTSEYWLTRCWHFCSCSSHKTIPSLGEWRVTQQCFISRCNVTALSIGLTQVLIIITWVGY